MHTDRPKHADNQPVSYDSGVNLISNEDIFRLLKKDMTTDGQAIKVVATRFMRAFFTKQYVYWKIWNVSLVWFTTEPILHGMIF